MNSKSQSELIENASTARTVADRAMATATTLRAQHETAHAEVVNAENAYGTDASAQNWKALTEARTAADRADLIARHAERVASETLAGAVTAERERDRAAFNELAAMVSPAGYSARLAGPIAEYADAYDRLHAAHRRLIGVAIEHNQDCARATILAASAGIETRPMKFDGRTHDVVHIDGEPARHLEGERVDRALTHASHAAHEALAARGVEYRAMDLVLPHPTPPAEPKVRRAFVRTPEAIEEERLARATGATYERGPELLT